MHGFWQGARNDFSRIALGGGSPMMRGMSWSNFNHMRLLRYVGLFTYICVGVPLLQGDWGLTTVSSWWSHSPALLGWAVSYLTFGASYLALTSHLHTRPGLLKILGLVVMTISAIVVGWYSQSGLSAMLMVVISVVLPWLLTLPAGLMWMLIQNLLLIPIIANYPNWTILTATLQVCMYLGISALTFFTSRSPASRPRRARRSGGSTPSCARRAHCWPNPPASPSACASRANCTT